MWPILNVTKAKNDNMPLGIIFKPKHIENDIWLARMEEHDEEEEHEWNKSK